MIITNYQYINFQNRQYVTQFTPHIKSIIK